MKEQYVLMIAVVAFHWLDMLFTMLLVKKHSKHMENPEIIELNYHQWFFKKFGIFKGGLISLFCVSTPFIIIITYLANLFLGLKIIYVILGMMYMVAYINFNSWIQFDDLQKKAKRIDSNV